MMRWSALLSVFFMREPGLPRRFRYLEDLFVDPAFRGQGIARTMIKSLQSEGAAEGWSRLYWHTRRDNPARHLYDEFTPADDYVRYRITLES